MRFEGCRVGSASGGMFMTDVLTWTIGRRLELAKRAELLRRELDELELGAARLEAAEVVFGQWVEATDGGRRASCRRSRSRLL